MTDASKPSFFSGLRSRTKHQRKFQKQTKSGMSPTNPNSAVSNESPNLTINSKPVRRSVNQSQKRHSVFISITPNPLDSNHSIAKSKSSSSLIDVSFDSIDSDSILNNDVPISNLENTQSHLNSVFNDYNSKLFLLTEASPSSSSSSSSSLSSNNIKPPHPLRKLLIHSPNASNHSLLITKNQNQCHQHQQKQNPIVTLNIYKPKLDEPKVTTLANTLFFGSKSIQPNDIFNDFTNYESFSPPEELLELNFNLVDPIFTSHRYNHLHTNHRTSLYFV